MLSRLIICCCLLVATLTAAASAADVSEFINFSLSEPSGVVLPGRLYVPPQATADPTKPRPLIVWLHGGGDAGSNNLNQIRWDIDLLFAEAKRRGAFLYAPQAPLNWRPTNITSSVSTMLDRAVSQFNVDPDRLYLTGYSSGGGGVWNMLSRHAGLFAASVPVAPVNPEPDFIPGQVAGQPLAIFHARDDVVAPVSTTRNVFNRILTAAGEPLPRYPSSFETNPLFTFDVPELDLHYIEPAQGGHAVHFSVYSTPQVYDWMFSHGDPVPEPRSLITAGLALLVLFNTARRQMRS